MKTSSHYRHFINGDFVEPSSKERIEVRCPATGELVGTVPLGSEEDIARACEAAESAFESGPWGKLDPLERGHILRAFADALAAELEPLVELECRVTGRPIREMRAQVGRVPEWLHYFAGLAKAMTGETIPFKGQFLNYTQHHPYGVVGLLTPWNHPLLILVKKLAAALAAGNCVVVKPSELAPISPLKLAEIGSRAGLPPGVLNVVTGDGPVTGSSLCLSPQVARLDLTGGCATGRKVAKLAAERLIPATMELGGKAPVVIFSDTPIEEAVRASAFAAFIASGQTCISGTRFLVEKPLYESYTEAFAVKTEAIRLGHPLDTSTDMGPVISEPQYRRALDHIERALNEGGRCIAGGGPASLEPPLSRGWYVKPTIIADTSAEMSIFKEEIFGPVVSVQPFEDEEDAIRLANTSRFGLGASVWTRNIMRAHRVSSRIKAGIVWINDHHKNDPASPWGGFGESGYGKENGWDALKDYLVKQSVVVRMSDEYPDWYADQGSSRYG